MFRMHFIPRNSDTWEFQYTNISLLRKSVYSKVQATNHTGIDIVHAMSSSRHPLPHLTEREGINSMFLKGRGAKALWYN